jgi:hypothetical protein
MLSPLSHRRMQLDLSRRRMCRGPLHAFLLGSTLCMPLCMPLCTTKPPLHAFSR